MSSNREPMWYCHECNAEMRPLMVPDPVCASCHSSFVEKLENPADDPRSAFVRGAVPGEADDDANIGNIFFNLQSLLSRGMQPNQRPPTQQQRPQGSPMTFQFRGGTGQQRTFQFGGDTTHSHSHSHTHTHTPHPRGSPNPTGVPTMTGFLREGESPPTMDREDGINGALFAQYLASLLGNTDNPLLPFLAPGGGMPDNGRLGDYVFSQDALDQIITQIMENSNSNRPVPASEEIIQKLSRDVLEEGSDLLSKECAVCKDPFQLGTEDPDEQIIITLPCKHPFHQPCILPWLKSSGTCPVCRYALIPQPEHHSPPPTSPGNDHSRSRPRSPGGSGSGLGIFSTLFGNLAGVNNNNNASGSSTSSRQNTSNNNNNFYRGSTSSASRSRPTSPRATTLPSHSRSSQQQRSSWPASPRSSGRNGRPYIPGEWSDDPDMMDLD